MIYNPYINNFSLSGDFETYIESSGSKIPNVAYLKDIDEMRYTNTKPYSEYLVYGTTTGTTDFSGAGITFHVVESVDGSDNIFYATSADTPANITDLYYCFKSEEGEKITKLKKWAIDTSNVTNMSYMFSIGSNLTSVDLSSFDTSNVTNMHGMFYGCSNLTLLDLSSFNASNVTNMGDMLGGGTNPNKLYISSSFFNSPTITNYNMFRNNSSWTDADSIEQFVQAAEISNGNGKTIDLSTETLNAMTQAQKDRITGAGWTLQ